MAAADQDTSRVAVKTYVPAYQREEWDEHATELDMSRSEFVRSMVQAGRRGFDPWGDGPETAPDDSTEDGPQDDGASTDSAAGPPSSADRFDEVILELVDEECLSWEELVAALTEDVEQQLEESIQRLQEANQIQHSGRKGGYVRVE